MQYQERPKWMTRCVGQLRRLYQNTPDCMALTTKIDFLNSGDWNPRSRFQQDWCLIKALPLGGTQPPSHCVFTWPFLGACTQIEISGGSSYMDTNPIRSEPHPYDCI